MAQDIKRKIVLEGEKEYSAALKEAQRNLKTLRSELKAETAELGANATAQQKSETRIKSLQKQIKEQEKVVKTCQAALAEAKKEYGDNEEVVAKWEQKLNDARATLANMKNDLESTSQAVRDTGNSYREAADGAAAVVTATKSAADALGQIGSVGDSISGAIENIFTGMLQTIEKAVEAAWEIVSETAAKANNWGDIAGYWGTDAQTIQQYARAVSASANSFEDLNAAVTKIVLGGKGKKITELVGISGVNYKDEWAYAMAVMNRIYEMQQSGQNMNPIWEEIFGGKQSTKIMDLINDWGEIQKNLGVFNGNETAFGMTDDELQTMNDLWVTINRVEEKYDALKDKFAAGLGTATGSLLVNVEGGLNALADFLDAETPEEREKALDDLRTNVEEFFRKVADIIREGIAILNEVGHELQESDDPLTALVGDILVKMTEALQWMVDNQDAVKGAFEAIFGAWLLAKLAAVAGKLSGILLQIEAIKAFKGLELGGAAAAAETGAAGATETGAAGAAAAAAAAGNAAQITTTAGTQLPGWLNFLSIGALFKTAKEASEKTGMGLYGELYRKQQMQQMSIEGIVDPETGEVYSVEEWAEILKEREAQEAAQATKPKGGRVKKVTGKATEESMQGHFPDELEPEEEKEPAEIVRPTVPETAEAIYDAMYKAINDYDPDTNQLNTTDFFDLVLWPMIQKQAELGGVVGDEVGAIADLIYDKWIQSMYDEDWEGSTAGILNILEEAIEEAAEGKQPEGPEPTDEQKDAAEAFWDIFRHSMDGAPDAFDELLAAFEGSDELLSRLDALIGELENSTADDGWRSIENLPANWWLDAANWQNSSGNNNGITSADLQGFRSLPGNMAAAVQSGAARGVSGIKVILDGATVGRLVAPYVSETIARDVIL